MQRKAQQLGSFCDAINFSQRENGMTDSKRTPNPQRVAFLRSLPQEVKEQITGEEAESFIFGEDIPESLYEKIKGFLQEEK